MPTQSTTTVRPRARWGEGMGFLRAALTIETEACILWPFGTSAGYGEVNIRLPDGRRQPVGAHVLACEHLHGPRPPGMEAAHQCRSTRCVNPKHLEWKSHWDNTAIDRARDGTEVWGSHNGCAKLTEAEVLEIRSLWATGYWTQLELAAEFGVVRQTIGKIVGRRRWRHI